MYRCAELGLRNIEEYGYPFQCTVGNPLVSKLNCHRGWIHSFQCTNVLGSCLRNMSTCSSIWLTWSVKVFTLEACSTKVFISWLKLRDWLWLGLTLTLVEVRSGITVRVNPILQRGLQWQPLLLQGVRIRLGARPRTINQIKRQRTLHRSANQKPTAKLKPTTTILPKAMIAARWRT